MPLSALNKFLKMEAAGGIVLVAAAAVAIIVANSSLGDAYMRLWSTPTSISVGSFVLDKPLLKWVNDGLMVMFFFIVGLEIKREVMAGELSSRERAVLPAAGAIGGMAVPALIYVAINFGHPEHLNGWAIPAATDIAFALGVLALLGSRVPLSLKVLLTAIAILDDLGAIIIIALFYTEQLSHNMLALAGTCLVVLVGLNLAGVRRITPFLLIGAVLWMCVLKSGVHATLAGVALAMTIPLRTPPGHPSPLLELEHGLHKWVAFVVLPIFGFANAGVSFAGMTWGSFLQPVTLGIALGLYVGKQIGVAGMMWLAVRVGLARMPADATWAQLYGVALLCGIGFTMSLFIGSLAWEHELFAAPVRLGVLAGSIASAVTGAIILLCCRRAPQDVAAAVTAGDGGGTTAGDGGRVTAGATH